MTNVILTAAQKFGPTLVRTAGRIGVAYAQRAITNAFDNRVFEGPRLETLHIQSSRDGAPMARVFGRARIAGQIIWAAKVRENVTDTRQGSKGGPRSREYTYTLSFAVGLCEGEILGAGQIWANSQPLQMTGLNTRLYLGTEDQAPDPLIVEIEGHDVPAFRGTAYMVFEDMPIDDFGARLPQLNFEIIRLPERTNDEARLEDLVKGVDLIPGSGEFVYGSSITEERLGPGTSRALNMNNLTGQSDLDAALDQLQTQLPNCASVTLVVSWFGDDLRAAHCKIRPGVEGRERTLSPLDWQVNGDTRTSAYLISQTEDRPTYGGTPHDRSIIEAIQGLKSRGFKVSLYPFILMDIPADNVLPDKDGIAPQPAFPWRGRVSCDTSVDNTALAIPQVEAFFGACSPTDFAVSTDTVSYTGADENSLRRMILHYAHLVQQAGGVDGFIIGSELRGITTIRANGDYPAVQAFQTLAADVRSIVGAATKLTYAADWTEYFGHHVSGPTTNVYYHLDPLWADANIDAVGIDAYFPLADWRDGDAHLDAQISPDMYDLDYLQSNMEGGEGYDWYYPSTTSRDLQDRTPIVDGLNGKHWVYRYKDIRNWWGNPHYNRVDGNEEIAPSAWIPQSKPIWFTEIGCPAIDKGANQPNVFWDPKSSESYAPYFSSGTRDDLIQRRYLEAFLGYWDIEGMNPISSIYGGPMIDLAATHVWCWDARPFPDFPARLDVWADGENWQTGHWISGRTGLVSLADIVSELTISSGSLAPDVTRLNGMVSGYVVDRPMSARAAITPLSLAYGFDLSEGASRLRFASKGVQIPITLNLENCAQNIGDVLLTLNREDAGQRPKDVRLSFIEQGREYQAGSVTAQGLLAETERVVDIQAPLVLDPAQAKTIAQNLLAQALQETSTIEFNLPPAYLSLEAGDVITITGEDGRWQIIDVDGLGQRHIQARQIETRGVFIHSGAEPGVSGSPAYTAIPDGYVLDIVDFTQITNRQGPLAGVIVAPWVESSFQTADGTRVSADSPVSIGYTLHDLPAGCVGRYDYANSIDIYLPNVDLASLDDDALFAGGNRLAVETESGWEVFQCQNIRLTAPNRYTISHFLRGQAGSDSFMPVSIPQGAQVVYLGRGWLDLPVETALRGTIVNFTLASLGRSDEQALMLPYEAVHLRPLSPVHVKTQSDGANTYISWIRRTRIGGDDWASVDVPMGEDIEQYEIDFMDGSIVLATKIVTEPNVQISYTELETLYGGPLTTVEIAIAQMSRTYGRGAICAHTFNP